MLVLAKDIVVVGSDGLFDNVPIEEIRQELEGAIDKSTGIIINKQELAESLAKKAIQYGQDEDYDSPFSQGAR
jgi:serine/threonine protein phosphatase PrpC